MLPGIAYEYYASRSNLKPKYAYSRDQHETAFYYRFISNPEEYPDYVTSAVTFYTEKSGLTPVASYTIEEHVDAYFNTQNILASWELIIENEALALVGGTILPGTNLFTSLFESGF